jgi:transcriptional regulator with XRE-family HTH domain
LARLAGLSQSAVASYESGERQSSRGLLKLAATLGVEAQWLDTGKGPMERAEDGYAITPASSRYAVMEETAHGEFGEARKSGEWPFASIARSRYDGLTGRDKRHLETMVGAFVEACHANYAAARPKGKSRRGD